MLQSWAEHNGDNAKFKAGLTMTVTISDAIRLTRQSAAAQLVKRVWVNACTLALDLLP